MYERQWKAGQWKGSDKAVKSSVRHCLTNQAVKEQRKTVSRHREPAVKEQYKTVSHHCARRQLSCSSRRVRHRVVLMAAGHLSLPTRTHQILRKPLIIQ